MSSPVKYGPAASPGKAPAPWKWLVAGVLLRVGLGLALIWLVGRTEDPQATDGNRISLVLSQWLQLPDAHSFHIWAERLVLFWQGKSSQNPGVYWSSYPWLLAKLYYYSVPHLLTALVVNALCLAGAAWVAFRSCLLLGQSGARARGISLLIFFWPPSFAYALLPLRYSWWLLVIMTLIWGCLALCSFPARSWSERLATPIALAGGLYMVSALRPHLFSLSVSALALGLVFFALLAWGGRARRWLAGGLAAGLVLAGLLVVGTGFQPLEFHLARNPKVGELAQTHKNIPTSRSRERDYYLGFEGEGLVGPVERSLKHLVHLREEFIRAGGRTLSTDARGLRSALGFDESSGLIELNLWRKRTRIARDYSPDLAPHLVLGDWLKALARGLRDLFFFPAPWSSAPVGTSMSWTKLPVIAQSILWYLLLPGLIWGLAQPLANPSRALVLSWCWVLSLFMALVITNLGTLYRYRDTVFLPGLLLFSPAPYAWLHRLFRKR